MWWTCSLEIEISVGRAGCRRREKVTERKGGNGDNVQKWYCGRLDLRERIIKLVRFGHLVFDSLFS